VVLTGRAAAATYARARAAAARVACRTRSAPRRDLRRQGYQGYQGYQGRRPRQAFRRRCRRGVVRGCACGQAAARRPRGAARADSGRVLARGCRGGRAARPGHSRAATPRPPVGARRRRHPWLARGARGCRLLPLLRRRVVRAGAPRCAPDRAPVGLDSQPLLADPPLDRRGLALRGLAGCPRRSPRCARAVLRAPTEDNRGHRRHVAGRRLPDFRPARSAIPAPRSDVPRPSRRRAARAVWLSRVRRLEFRTQHLAAPARL
jgi:hypothetical protein